MGSPVPSSPGDKQGGFVRSPGSDPAEQEEDEEDQRHQTEDAAGDRDLEQHQDDRDDDEKPDQRTNHLNPPVSPAASAGHWTGFLNERDGNPAVRANPRKALTSKRYVAFMRRQS